MRTRKGLSGLREKSNYKESTHPSLVYTFPGSLLQNPFLAGLVDSDKL